MPAAAALMCSLITRFSREVLNEYPVGWLLWCWMVLLNAAQLVLFIVGALENREDAKVKSVITTT